MQGGGFVGCPHAAGFSGMKYCFFLQCSSHGWAYSSSSYSVPFPFVYHDAVDFEQFLKASLTLQLLLIYSLMFLCRYTIDGLLLQSLAEHRLLLRFLGAIQNAALGLRSDSPTVAALWVSLLPHPAECGTSRLSLLRLEQVL